MKKFNLLVVLLISFLGQAQEVIVETHGRADKALLKGLHNYMSIAVEGVNNNEYLVYAEDVVIEKQEQSNLYKVNVPIDFENSSVKLLIKYKTSNRSIDSRILRVKEPKAEVFLYPNNKQSIRGKSTLRIHLNLDNIDVKIQLRGYTVLLVRDDKVLFCERGQGNRIEGKIRNLLKQVEIGDEIILYKLDAYVPGYGNIATGHIITRVVE